MTRPMTKYKEQLYEGEPETNPFKVGDRVRVYRASAADDVYYRDGVVTKVRCEEVIYGSYFAHFRQCRRLVPVEPRETAYCWDHAQVSMPDVCASRCDVTLVRECLDD